MFQIFLKESELFLLGLLSFYCVILTGLNLTQPIGFPGGLELVRQEEITLSATINLPSNFMNHQLLKTEN